MNLCKECKHFGYGDNFYPDVCKHPNFVKICGVTGNAHGYKNVYFARDRDCMGKWFEEKPIRWYQFWRK